MDTYQLFFWMVFGMLDFMIYGPIREKIAALRMAYFGRCLSPAQVWFRLEAIFSWRGIDTMYGVVETSYERT